MLPRYPAQTDVTVEIPLQDLLGNAVTPTALSYRVLDELDNVVQDVTSIDLPAAGATSISITVPAADNTLPAPTQIESDGTPLGNPVVTTKALREVELSMVTAAGTIIGKTQYIIQAASGLVLLINSFQTYNQAQLTAADLPGLTAWSTASEDEITPAMHEAWRRLTRLGYFVRWPRDPDAQNYLNWMDSRNEIIIPRLWSVMTTQRWMSYYPEIFRQAMRNAQVVEADQILGGDPVEKRRISGLLSDTIGQSSQMYRSGKPLDLGISRAALQQIQGYVDFRFTFQRV